jgi:hypothetical protein
MSLETNFTDAIEMGFQRVARCPARIEVRVIFILLQCLLLLLFSPVPSHHRLLSFLVNSLLNTIAVQASYMYASMSHVAFCGHIHSKIEQKRSNRMMASVTWKLQPHTPIIRWCHKLLRQGAVPVLGMAPLALSFAVSQRPWCFHDGQRELPACFQESSAFQQTIVMPRSHRCHQCHTANALCTVHVVGTCQSEETAIKDLWNIQMLVRHLDHPKLIALGPIEADPSGSRSSLHPSPPVAYPSACARSTGPSC